MNEVTGIQHGESAGGKIEKKPLVERLINKKAFDEFRAKETHEYKVKDGSCLASEDRESLLPKA